MLSAEAQHQERDLLIAIKYACDHLEFDRTFIHQLSLEFMVKHYLTDHQYKELRVVMDNHKMEDWFASKQGTTGFV